MDNVHSLHLLARVNNKLKKKTIYEVSDMNKKNQVKKVQISLPIEQYQEIEERWTSLGFNSVAEAGRFLLMDKVNEFCKGVKKSQKAILKLEELKQHAQNEKAMTAPVQSNSYQDKEYQIQYIAKGSDEYEKLTLLFKQQSPNYKEPNNIKGVTRTVDDKGNTKYGWWN